MLSVTDIDISIGKLFATFIIQEGVRKVLSEKRLADNLGDSETLLNEDPDSVILVKFMSFMFSIKQLRFCV